MEAKEAFLTRQPKGEITLLIEGVKISEEEQLSDSQLENKLGELISEGHSLSTVISLQSWVMVNFFLCMLQNTGFPSPIDSDAGAVKVSIEL